MSKIDPKNREYAFAYQFKDTVKRLKELSALGEGPFTKQLRVLKAQINAYFDPKLRDMCDKARQKHEKTMEFMRKNYLHLEY